MPGAITGIALELLLHFARRARPVPDSADSTHGLHPSD
jgi:hypothetical protein